MCEFCTQHGEGQKWYLNLRNYSREVWEQKGSEKYVEHFMARFEEQYGREQVAKLDALLVHKPAVSHVVRRMAVGKQKADHWGQVVPIEDMEQIVDMLDSIVRLPCVCRQLTTGREVRYCFGVGIVDPMSSVAKYPDYAQGLEVIEKDEAKKLLRSFDQQGLVHSVWTFKTPFIGGICNCDQDCLAYRIDVKAQLMQTMFRAEYVAQVDWEACSGCKKCLLNCQFGAIHYSNSKKRPTINAMACYGCGVCRAVCDHGAIVLKPRTDFVGLPW